MDDSINLEENFPYSGYSDAQLKEIIGEISNRIAKEENEVNLLRAFHYSSVAVNELNIRKFNEQIEILQCQLDNAKKDSKSSTIYAISAIIVSIILGIFNAWNTPSGEEDKLLYKQLLKTEQQQVNVQLDLLKSINQKRIYQNEPRQSKPVLSRKKP